MLSDALREWDVGELEARNDEAAWAQYWDVRRRWSTGQHDARVPGGESLIDLDRRFGGFLRDLHDSQLAPCS